MPFKFDGINYLAVVSAGLATFFLGAVWYTALFGKLWVQLTGYSEQKLKELQAKRPPPLFFGGMIVCYLVMSLAVAVLVRSLSIVSPIEGAQLGLVLWVGFAATIGFTAHLAGDRHIGIYLIDAGYQLVYLLLMGALIGGWH
jgi:hypothetical protein